MGFLCLTLMFLILASIAGSYYYSFTLIAFCLFFYVLGYAFTFYLLNQRRYLSTLNPRFVHILLKINPWISLLTFIFWIPMLWDALSSSANLTDGINPLTDALYTSSVNRYQGDQDSSPYVTVFGVFACLNVVVSLITASCRYSAKRLFLVLLSVFMVFVPSGATASLYASISIAMPYIAMSSPKSCYLKLWRAFVAMRVSVLSLSKAVYGAFFVFLIVGSPFVFAQFSRLRGSDRSFDLAKNIILGNFYSYVVAPMHALNCYLSGSLSYSWVDESSFLVIFYRLIQLAMGNTASAGLGLAPFSFEFGGLYISSNLYGINLLLSGLLGCLGLVCLYFLVGCISCFALNTGSLMYKICYALTLPVLIFYFNPIVALNTYLVTMALVALAMFCSWCYFGGVPTSAVTQAHKPRIGRS